MKTPEHSYALVLAGVDLGLSLAFAGFDLHAVLRSKIALTTLVLMLMRAVLSCITAHVEQLHPAAIVVSIASATAGVAAASLRRKYVKSSTRCCR